MDTLDFLQRVTGSAGYYSLLAIGPKKRRVQKFYKTAEQLIDAAINFDENGYDAYFALGRFNNDDSREADNVAQMRAFFLDLDCGPTKDYADQPSALAALRSFVKQTKLTKPIIVNSGRGIHAYWPLPAPITRAQWQPIADRFKSACKSLGLRIDGSVTADAARVLRVPGTGNHKDNPPKPVEILAGGAHVEISPEHFDACVSPHAKVSAETVSSTGLFGDKNVRVLVDPKSTRETSAVMDALTSNIEASFKKIAKRSAEGKGCGQIAQLLTDPDSADEPLWRAGLSIAVRCKESKAIHWLSQGHSEYDPDDTVEKADRTKGPYLCAKFDDLNPGVCGNCPHWGKIKSPIVLGHVLAEAAGSEEVVVPPTAKRGPRYSGGTVTIPEYPAPYVRGKTGGVYLKTLDDDGEIKINTVWNNDLYVVRRLIDPEQGELVEMRHHLPRDGIRTFVIPLYNVTSKEEFRKVLATNGVAAINKEVDTLMAYTQTWVKELQHIVQADDAHRQYGWVDTADQFILGDKVISATGIDPNASTVTTRSTIDYFKPKGTLEGWKDAMDFYNRPGFELHQLIVCAGFGSVLMKFMPVNAALIHIWSKNSGFGKTTVQQAALSIWGDPKPLMLGEKDTHNSRMQRADVFHSLPVCMDEITNIHPKEASDMIYQITGGMQKNRMSSNGNSERLRGDPWNLLFISSANSSLIDRVSMAKAMPKAEAQRVLEIEVGQLFNEKTDKVLTDEFSRKLQANYGHAGVLFVQYVMQNLDDVRILVETIQRQIDAAAALGPDNRFWSAAVATSVAAAVICNHRLGLLRYDVAALTKYVVRKVLRTNQAASVDLSIDALELATEFAYQNWGKILQIQGGLDMRTHKNGLDNLVMPEQLPRGTDFVGRYETDMRRLFLRLTPFKEWLAERQMNSRSVIDDLIKNHGAKKDRVRLSKGTHMHLDPVCAIVIPVQIGSQDGGEEEN